MSRLLAAAAALAVLAAPALAADKPGTALDFKMKGNDGKDVDLAQYKGKVVMFVNVASYCGNTKQYTNLQALHEKYGKDGLVIVGVPCNQFGKQEPGTDEDIAKFCSTKYKVSFPLLSKVDVNGKEACDLYKYLTDKDVTKDGEIKWNFEKFVVGKDGKVVARFKPGLNPEDKSVVDVIEAELKK